ncbi:hypothetical protein TSUD_78350 [Trifolium subterraneum]|uniref:Uncharacterized protein n=1 Tax=Trifolium subterraneum TaxID=3900 RepID=A0A2Z6M4C9_TRISU|nr:hypothetical protein TSUD_78350 [Trifolium subterraneum]
MTTLTIQMSVYLVSQNYWYALSKFSDDPISNEVQQFSDDRSLSQNPGENLKPVKEVEDPLSQNYEENRQPVESVEAPPSKCFLHS